MLITSDSHYFFNLLFLLFRSPDEDPTAIGVTPEEVEAAVEGWTNGFKNMQPLLQQEEIK